MLLLMDVFPDDGQIYPQANRAAWKFSQRFFLECYAHDSTATLNRQFVY